MSAIRDAIAAELDEARAVAEKALERVQQLEELDAQATQLDGEETPAAASPPRAATPAPPRRKPSTPAGRRPAAPTAQRANVPRGQAHTASGAPAGGRRDGKPPRIALPAAADLAPKVRDFIASSEEPVTVAEIIRHLGGPTKGGTGSKWGERVREVIAALLKAGDALPASPGRGGHPRYMSLKVRPRERAIPAGIGAPSSTRPQVNPIDRLLGRILEQLELDGGRVARSDLRDRLSGDVVHEDFNLAVDRGVNLKKIVKTSAGGVVGYERAR